MLKKIFFLTKQIKIRAVSFIRAEIKKTIKVDQKWKDVSQKSFTTQFD